MTREGGLLMQDIALLEKQRCSLILTNKAKEAVEECSANEHAFFTLQRSFTVYIEKRKAKKLVKPFYPSILMRRTMKN